MPGFTTKNGVDYNFIWYGVILPATESYNEDPTEIQGMFAAPINETYIRQHHLGGGSYMELASLENPDQVSIEQGRLLPLPKFFGLGKGYTWPYLVDATDGDIAQHERQLQYRDREFMRQQIFASLFVTPGTRPDRFGLYDGNFKAEEGLTAPPPYGVLTFTATHTHYVGTGAPLASGIMLEDIAAGKKHIREHGRMGEIVCFVSEKQMNQLELLALPIFDPTRRAGLGGVATNKTLVQQPMSDEVVRTGFRGSLLGVTFIESAFIPEDYFVMAETGGAMKGMFYQQKDNPIAQGLINFPGDTNYPIINSRQYRWHKFGVRVRDFAVVYKLGAAADAYTSPAPYSTMSF